MEFITTQKGAQSLLWEGSRFTINRKMANGTIYWRCSKRSCPARITTDGEQLLQQTNGHNHPVDPVELRVEEIKSKLRKRAREEVVPIPAIYNDALVELSTQQDCASVAANLPTFTSVKSSMYRSRRSRLPTLPKSRAEITLDGDWVNTLSGERFLLWNEGSDDQIRWVYLAKWQLPSTHMELLLPWWSPHKQLFGGVAQSSQEDLKESSPQHLQVGRDPEEGASCNGGIHWTVGRSDILFHWTLFLPRIGHILKFINTF